MTSGDVVKVTTPEGIEFSLPLAGFQMISPGMSQALYTVLYFSISLLYGIVTEWVRRGQTIGKRLLGLRVVDSKGLRLKPAQIVVRNLLRSVDMLPGLYLVGGIVCMLTRHRQRLGDIAAETIVVRIEEDWQLDVNQLRTAKYNSFLPYRHLSSRLRQRAELAATKVALDAVLRCDEIAPSHRLELFRQFADYFRAVAQSPPGGHRAVIGRAVGSKLPGHFSARQFGCRGNREERGKPTLVLAASNLQEEM